MISFLVWRPGYAVQITCTDDARPVAILRAHVKLPDPMWMALTSFDLTFNAEDHTVVTRDRSDYDKAGVPVFNPWDAL